MVLSSPSAQSRLFAFGVIPAAASPAACVSVLKEMNNTGSDVMKGIILGTTGLNGAGLDCAEKMDPVYQHLEKTGGVLFIHPHYGIKGEDMSAYGHSLELALG